MTYWTVRCCSVPLFLALARERDAERRVCEVGEGFAWPAVCERRETWTFPTREAAAAFAEKWSRDTGWCVIHPRNDNSGPGWPVCRGVGIWFYKEGP